MSEATLDSSSQRPSANSAYQVNLGEKMQRGKISQSIKSREMEELFIF